MDRRNFLTTSATLSVAPSLPKVELLPKFEPLPFNFKFFDGINLIKVSVGFFLSNGVVSFTDIDYEELKRVDIYELKNKYNNLWSVFIFGLGEPTKSFHNELAYKMYNQELLYSPRNFKLLKNISNIPTR